jgi:CO dehydrogenase nickel-insertion accessory protein CooC1
VEVFDLAVRGKQLPAKLDELVTLGFIGQTAVLNRIKADKSKKKLGAFKAKNPPVTSVDKPDINLVAMEMHGKLLEFRGKLREIKRKQRAARPWGRKGLAVTVQALS